MKKEAVLKDLNRVGVKYFIGAIVIGLVQILGSLLIKVAFPGISDDTEIDLSFILIILSVDLIGFPVLYMLLRKDRSWESRPDEKFGFLNFIQFFCICYLAMFAGAMIGNVISTMLTGSNANAATSLILGSSNLFLRELAVGIMAPIFEELIFRKLLIDHLAFRGKYFAMFTSAAFFALFHGNFSQFFYTFGLGLIFAFIYIKTGRIRYSIIYHMIINSFSSVIYVWIIKNAFGNDITAEELSDMPALIEKSGGVNSGIILVSLYGLMLMGLAGLGLLSIILNLCLNKNFLVKEDGDPNEIIKGKEAFKAFFTSYGYWLFIIVCIGIFIFQFVNAVN